MPCDDWLILRFQSSLMELLMHDGSWVSINSLQPRWSLGMHTDTSLAIVSDSDSDSEEYDVEPDAGTTRRGGGVE